MDNKEDIIAQALVKLNDHLAAHQMRKTAERTEILKAVIRIGTIFTVDQLIDFMRENSPFVVSRATVFNVMEVLEEAKLVFRHPFNRCFQYEFRMGKRPLVYTLCDNCGELKHFDKSEVTQFLAGLRNRQFSIKQPILYLHGYCKKCEKALKRREKKKEIKTTIK